MTILVRIILLLSSFFLLVSCAYNVKDVNSPFYQPPVNSRFQIHQPITIPADRASVFIQEGKTRGGSFNHFMPHCRLEVRHVLDVPQIVQPVEFTVTRVYRDLPPVVALKPVHYADSGASSGDSGVSMDLIYVIYMRLSSEEQPDVLNITCGGSTDDPSAVVPPSIDGIRSALGELVSLLLPDEWVFLSEW